MPDPRVIFVNRVYWPSTESTAQLLTDLAEGLAKRGWSVHVIASGESSLTQAGVMIHRAGGDTTARGLLSRVSGNRRFINEARVVLEERLAPGDIVVAMTDPPMLGAMIAEVALERDARVVQWIQDIYPEIAAEHFGTVARPFLLQMRGRRDRAWQDSHACVVLGEDMQAVVAERGVPAERIQVLPNWAPSQVQAPSPEAAAAVRRDVWQAGDKFVVAYSGNLGRVHEFATILDAAEALQDTPEVEILIIGRGPRYAAVQSAVRRRRLANVGFLPPAPRANLGASLAAADAHLVTLRPEYNGLVFPSKFAGVLVAGRPVLFVGPPEGDIARMIQQNDCGAVFAPGQGEEMAATIRAWHADRALTHRLGLNAWTFGLTRFGHDTGLSHWDRFLRQVAGAVR